jgi:hypothetical protein
MRLVTRLLEGLTDEYRRQSEQQCFVAHEFDNVDIRSRLGKALEAINLQPYFADSEVTSELLLGKICSKILATRAFVVDVSSLNANVYFELGLAVGFNKPIMAILKEGKAVPSILDNFVNFRFTHYSELEQELTRQMPVWFASATENEALYTSHCHFLNRFCDDRNRISPGRVYYVIDETKGDLGQIETTVKGVNPDLRETLQSGLKRFNFELALLDDAPSIDDFRFCDFCRASRNAAFGVVNVSRHTTASVYMFAGLFLSLGITPLFLVKTPDEEGLDVLPPTLLRGLDYLTYQHFTELEEQLPKRLEEFLNQQTRPLIDRILVDLPPDDSDRPTGRVLTWSVMQAGADHGRLIEEHVEEMFSDRFPRMLIYVYVGTGASILETIKNYLEYSLTRGAFLSEAFRSQLSWPRSFDDNQSIQQAALEGFRATSLNQVARRIDEDRDLANSSHKTIWLQEGPLKGSGNMHISLGKYISWLDNNLIPALPESAHVVAQWFLHTRNAPAFAASLAEGLRTAHVAPKSVVRIANDITDTRESQEYWRRLLGNLQNCG